MRRFWGKVKKRRSGCWEWTGARTPFGHGKFWLNGHVVRAHRVAARVHDLPPEIVVRHRCDNPSCVRPDHLEIGTVQENVNDRQRRGRSRGGRPKLDAKKVRRIRALAESGEYTYADLAARYGVHPSTVARAAKAERWTYV